MLRWGRGQRGVWGALHLGHFARTAKAKLGASRCGFWALCAKRAMAGWLKLSGYKLECLSVLRAWGALAEASAGSSVAGHSMQDVAWQGGCSHSRHGLGIPKVLHTKAPYQGS